jgi:hypothetical protein
MNYYNVDAKIYRESKHHLIFLFGCAWIFIAFSLSLIMSIIWNTFNQPWFIITMLTFCSGIIVPIVSICIWAIFDYGLAKKPGDYNKPVGSKRK